MGVARPQVVGVDAFASLSRRGQLGRLRRVGRTALASYGLDDARLTLQRHEQNTTFRVDARDGRYLLRINRPRVHAQDTIGSEMAWLSALRRDTDLGVPEPVAARNGSFVVVARDAGMPEPHVCVLLHWLDGRFINRRLAPVHLRRPSPPSGSTHERSDTTLRSRNISEQPIQVRQVLISELCARLGTVAIRTEAPPVLDIPGVGRPAEVKRQGARPADARRRRLYFSVAGLVRVR